LGRSTVSYLARKFVAYVQLVHQESTLALRGAMDARGGYILHIDGTCEEASRVLLVCMDSLSMQVLESRRIPSESHDQVRDVLRGVDRDWGRPLAIVHDLGIVVGRLRKDACLFDLPPEGCHGNRIYGHNKISLAKRAAHPEGWQTITYRKRKDKVTRQYKTFLATSELVSGVIRVVTVRLEDGGWIPYFCTDPSAKVCDILEAAAGGPSRNTSMTWRRFGARASNRSATCGRTSAIGT